MLDIIFILRTMKSQLFINVAFLALGALAQEKRVRSGFVGYGIDAFDPFYAQGCRDAISGATLSCSDVTSEDMGGMSGMSGMVMTEPKCYATDDTFLQTLALCM